MYSNTCNQIDKNEELAQDNQVASTGLEVLLLRNHYGKFNIQI